MLARVKDQLRFASALWRFLDGTITPEQARINVEQQLVRREASFRDILERGIYGHEKSPHRRLFAPRRGAVKPDGSQKQP